MSGSPHYGDGRAARRAGRPITDCPKAGLQREVEWRRGWRDQEKKWKDKS